MDLKKHNSVKSLHRALNILRLISEYEENGLHLSKIARKAELPLPTARRLVQALTNDGFVKFDSFEKKYFLGPDSYSIAKIDKYYKLRNTYHSALKAIAKKTKDVSYLLSRVELDLICIDRVLGDHEIQVIFDIGMRGPLGTGGAGIAILAASPDDEIEKILSGNKTRYFQQHKITLKKLRSAIKLSRKLGFGLSEGLYLKGVNAVGLPIYDTENRIIGAVSVSSVKDRLDRTRAIEVAEIIKSEISFIKQNVF
jgi:DNA-binding IclR family transcriptional regulator